MMQNGYTPNKSLTKRNGLRDHALGILPHVTPSPRVPVARFPIPVPLSLYRPQPERAHGIMLPHVTYFHSKSEFSDPRGPVPQIFSVI